MTAAGCASTSDATSALNPDPPSKMFAEADALLSKGKFDDAAKKLEDLDRDHPYAPEARRATVSGFVPSLRTAGIAARARQGGSR